MRVLRNSAVALAVVAILGFALAVAAPTEAAAEQSGFSVSKSASVNEVHPDGEEVTFTVYVENFDGFQIIAIVDSVFGDLVTPTDPRVTDSTCDLGDTVEETFYDCQFTAMVLPDGPMEHVNNVTVTTFGEVEEQATSNYVYINFVGISATKTAFPSTLPAAGGEVTFTFEVTNAGLEPLLLTALEDDIFGDLTDLGEASDCEVEQELAPGASYSCSLTETLGAGSADSPHVNTLKAMAMRIFEADALPANVGVANAETENGYGGGNTYIAMASAQVDYVTTGIIASKTADPTSVPEAGGDVTFTFGVTNTGEIDVIIDSLDDDIFGDLAGQGDCATGGTVPSGETYTCTVIKTLTGTAGQPHVNTFTANATTVDTTTLEENQAVATAGHQASASATVNFIAPEPTPTPVPASALATGALPSLQASPADPTAAPTPAPIAAPAPAASAVPDETVALAHTATESTLPAVLALTSISAGALILGALRRRGNNR